MKAYGYTRKTVNTEGLQEMSEVTFTGTPATIRQIALFLLMAADKMELHGSQFGHEHISDSDSGWHERWPDVIVAQGGEN
jgi:hypothetical protein